MTLRALPANIRQAVQKIFGRAYEGAAAGGRWKYFIDQPSALAAIRVAHGPIMRRARALYANAPLARSAVDVWTFALIGSGPKLQSDHPSPDVRERSNLQFEAWTDECDADGHTDFYGLLLLVATMLVRDGECFVLFVLGSDGRLQLRVLDPDQVDASLTQDLGQGRTIVQGVEFDAAGNRVAYHVRRDNPGLPFARIGSAIRIPAEDMCHVFRRDTAGQVRGISWLSAIVLRLADYDGAIDAQLVRQRVAALYAGFIVDPEGPRDEDEAKKIAPGLLEGGLEPGTLKILTPGKDIRFSEGADLGDEAINFLKITAREIAVGAGVPYESLTGDLTDVNFSSIRAGLIEFRRKVEALQHAIFAFQLLRRVWRRWATTEVLSGRMPAPGFFDNPAPYLALKVISPKSFWVDPLKDVTAEATAIAAGLASRRQSVAARGVDIEALDREISSDREREARLGLAFTTKPTPASASEPNDPDEAPRTKRMRVVP